MDSSGNLYGTTEAGGANGGCASDADLSVPGVPLTIGNCGTIFKLTKKTDGRWKESILYNFATGSDGFLPGAGVVMDKSGNLYGTTDGGGSAGCGVIYKLAPGTKGKWKYSVLHTFGYGMDGCIPAGNLAIDNKGNLYGGAILGGLYGYGIVFELSP